MKATDGQSSNKLWHLIRHVDSIKLWERCSQDKMPKEATIERKFLDNEDNCGWKVTPHCPYYAQVQGQLGLCGLQECDLDIYTKHGILVSTAVVNSSC